MTVVRISDFKRCPNCGAVGNYVKLTHIKDDKYVGECLMCGNVWIEVKGEKDD